MLAAWLKAFAQLGDPRLRRPVLWGVAVGALLFAALFGLGGWLVSLAVAGGGWLERVLTALGGLAAFLVAVVLFQPASMAVTGMLLDGVAEAVEARHYPALPPARPASLPAQLLASLRLAGRVALMSLLALPFALLLPGVGSLIWLVVSAYALSREYFELAALRRMGPKEARALRRANRFRVWLAGLPAAVLMLVPAVNLIVPVIGAAAFVHLLARSLERR